MELTIEKELKNPSYFYAVSPDRSRIAVAGERRITVYSLPDFKELERVKVLHSKSVVFLSDNRSLLIVSTTGATSLWDGMAVEKLGKWPVPTWQEEPLFSGGDDRAVWAGCGGIWIYDVRQRKIEKVYTSPRKLRICGCDGQTIKCIALSNDGEAAEAEILRISYGGQILQRAMTSVEIFADSDVYPAWSDEGTIAVATPVQPPLPLFMAYLLNEDGQVLGQEWIRMAADYGSFFCGSGMIAKVSAYAEKCILFLRADNFDPILKLDKKQLEQHGIKTPPTFAWFGVEGRIAIGCWDKLVIFKVNE